MTHPEKYIDKVPFSDLMPEFFNRIYSSWRDIQFEKYEVMYELMKKYEIDLGLSLDIGCGPFYLQEFFEEKGVEAEFICIDIDKDLKTSSYDFLIADGNRLPFKSETFDTVFIVDSLHFINRFEDVYNVLKFNGYIFVSTFVNIYNYELKRDEVEKKLKRFEILENFLNKGREYELVVLAAKHL